MGVGVSLFTGKNITVFKVNNKGIWQPLRCVFYFLPVILSAAFLFFWNKLKKVSFSQEKLKRYPVTVRGHQLLIVGEPSSAPLSVNAPRNLFIVKQATNTTALHSIKASM